MKTGYVYVAVVLLAGLAWYQFGTQGNNHSITTESASMQETVVPMASAVVQPQQVQATTGPTNELRLAGIITGGSNRALLSADGGEAALYSEGDQVADTISVSRIWDDHVTVLDDGITRELYLSHSITDDLGDQLPAAAAGKASTTTLRQPRIRPVQRNSDGQYVATELENTIPLQSFGLQPDDIIVAVNGRPARGRMAEKLNRFLANPSHKGGLDVTIQRDGKEIEMKLANPEVTVTAK